MAYFSFTRKILAGESIEVYGQGRMARDFTYIDDIVDGVLGALDNPPPVRSQRILNIGDSHPVGLMEMISTLEKALGRTAEKIRSEEHTSALPSLMRSSYAVFCLKKKTTSKKT